MSAQPSFLFAAGAAGNTVGPRPQPDLAFPTQAPDNTLDNGFQLGQTFPTPAAFGPLGNEFLPGLTFPAPLDVDLLGNGFQPGLTLPAIAAPSLLGNGFTPVPSFPTAAMAANHGKPKAPRVPPPGWTTSPSGNWVPPPPIPRRGQQRPASRASRPPSSSSAPLFGAANPGPKITKRGRPEPRANVAQFERALAQTQAGNNQSTIPAAQPVVPRRSFIPPEARAITGGVVLSDEVGARMEAQAIAFREAREAADAARKAAAVVAPIALGGSVAPSAKAKHKPVVLTDAAKARMSDRADRFWMGPGKKTPAEIQAAHAADIPAGFNPLAGLPASPAASPDPVFPASEDPTTVAPATAGELDEELSVEQLLTRALAEWDAAEKTAAGVDAIAQ
ncbi:hypothetical protein OQA88_3142 [Cercophora sp. LCS_1]